MPVPLLPITRRRLLPSILALAALRLPASAGTITDALGQNVTSHDPRRIVSIGSSVTEIIVALRQAERIVAIDTTSAGIKGVGGRPDVGYLRALSAEGVLSQAPDLICATSDAGPAEVIETLRASGIALALIAHLPTVAGIMQKIALLGTLLDSEEAAAALGDETRRKAEDLAARVSGFGTVRPGVLFVLSFTDNRLLAGGADTAAHTVIEMAGGRNVVQGMQGYKPVSGETLLMDPPDFIITMSGSGLSADAEAVLAFAPLQASPAARAKAIRAFDGAYLLGFGPSTIAAAGELAGFIHKRDPL